MFYPYTARQAHFIAIAQALAEKFAQRAAEHDREGTFPFENYADVRAVGLPALIVPEQYGGWGASLLETVMTMGALAVGDGSTALNVTMHMQTLGGAIEAQGWPAPLLEKVCRDAVDHGLLINSIATEPELGSPSRGGKPKTRAKPIYAAGEQPVAWVITGRKNFASMVPTLDYMIIPAVLDDGSEDVGRFLVPRSDAIEIIETWDAMGMRTTGSHDIILHDVRVPHDYIIGRGSTDNPHQKSKPTANPWFALGVSAVYVGVAVAALQAAARYAKERVPTALGKPIAELEGIQRRLGQAELLIHQAHTHLYAAADLWERYPAQRVELSPTIIAAKYTATNNAIDAVDHCMRVVGGSSMTKHLPLERYYRDVRGGLSHPMNDDQALILFGKVALHEAGDAVTA